MISDDAFLTRVARALQAEGADHRAVVLFPSRRARLFFLRAWTAIRGDPSAPTPRCYVWSEFVESHTPWLAAPDETLLIHLFEAYREVSGETPSFEGFSGWGRTLLNDINEIDLSLIDARRLFRTAYDWQQLKTEFSADEPSFAILEQFWQSVRHARHIRQHFLRFWQQMPHIYERFRRRLETAGTAYEGMIMRHGAENARAVFSHVPPLIAFVGFDFLTSAEQKIWHFFQKETTARFFWNIPPAYFELEKHFMTGSQRMADLMRRFPPTPIPRPPSEHPATLSVHHVPSRYYQHPALVANLRAHATAEDTAVIVPSDDLTAVLAEAWPADLPVNITAGLPLQFTPALSFLMLLRRLRSEEAPSGLMRGSLFRMLSRHPYFHYLFKKSLPEKDAGYYYPRTGLPALLQQLADEKDIAGWMAAWDALLEAAYEHTTRGTLHREALLRLIQADESLRQTAGPLSPDQHLEMMEGMLRNARLSLEGHPLQGIQVMGIYESRGLSFRRVHFLDFTEKFWPPAPPPSLIPFPLRKAFGMPYFHHRILNHYLYFFQMALGAAEVHVYVPHRAVTEELEPSRLIRLWPGNVADRQWQPAWQVKDHTPTTLSLSATPADTRRFVRLLTQAKGIAPSALNKLRKCPRLFLLSVIRQIKEPTFPLQAGMDARIFGNVLHRTLEELYRPAVGQSLRSHAADLLKRWNRIEEQIETVLHQYAADMGTIADNPYLYLMKAGVGQYVRAIIDADSRQAEDWILRGLEETVQGSLEMAPGAVLRFRGIIDRILAHPHKPLIRIEDYKTGRVEERDLRIKEPAALFEGNPADHYDVFFQQAFYGWLYARQENVPVAPHVWILRTRTKGSHPLTWANAPVQFHPGQTMFEEWEKALSGWLLPFWEAARSGQAIEFAPNPGPEKCRYCQFRVLCQAGT